MSRKIYRVPLDFDWPLNKVWKGFLNPHWKKCTACDGIGTTPGSRWLDEWLSEFERASLPCKYHKHTKEIAELFAAVTGVKEDVTLGSLATYSLKRKLLILAGLPNWGRCTICGGDGIDPEIRAKYEAWEEEPPPKGKGWQLWETVSEGSPISPVFSTKERFIDYLVVQGYSKEAATNFIKIGYVPSMMITTGGNLLKDIEMCDPP